MSTALRVMRFIWDLARVLRDDWRKARRSLKSDIRTVTHGDVE